MSTAGIFSSPERIAAIQAIRDRFKGDNACTQRARLLAVLQELGPTSTFELSRYADIYYPPARKLELVSEGHDILSRPCNAPATRMNASFFASERGA